MAFLSDDSSTLCDASLLVLDDSAFLFEASVKSGIYEITSERNRSCISRLITILPFLDFFDDFCNFLGFSFSVTVIFKFTNSESNGSSKYCTFLSLFCDLLKDSLEFSLLDFADDFCPLTFVGC